MHNLHEPIINSTVQTNPTIPYQIFTKTKDKSIDSPIPMLKLFDPLLFDNNHTMPHPIHWQFHLWWKNWSMHKCTDGSYNGYLRFHLFLCLCNSGAINIIAGGEMKARWLWWWLRWSLWWSLWCKSNAEEHAGELRKFKFTGRPDARHLSASSSLSSLSSPPLCISDPHF